MPSKFFQFHQNKNNGRADSSFEIYECYKLGRTVTMRGELVNQSRSLWVDEQLHLICKRIDNFAFRIFEILWRHYYGYFTAFLPIGLWALGTFYAWSKDRFIEKEVKIFVDFFFLYAMLSGSFGLSKFFEVKIFFIYTLQADCYISTLLPDLTSLQALFMHTRYAKSNAFIYTNLDELY